MKNSLLTSLFLLTACSVSFVQTASATPEEISFSKAWKLVNTRNDTLKAAQVNVEHAEHKKESATSLYFPEVTLSANYLYLDDEVTLSPNDIFESMPAGNQAATMSGMLAHSYGLSPAQLNAGLTSTIAERENFLSSLTATWPVYTGGRISAAQDIAASQVSEATNNLQLEAMGQFQHLVEYYFGAVLAKRIYTTRQEVETGLKKHRDHAILMEKQGQIAKVERMQAEASYDKAVVERKKAFRDLEIALVALSELLKSEQAVAPGDFLFVEKNLPDMNNFVTGTLSKYPGLKVLDSKKEQAQGLVKAENGHYHPTVALFGNYNLYEEDNLATKLAPDWMVGVGVSFPLLERSGRSGKLQAAKSTVRRIEHLKNQAESDLTVLVEKSYRQTQQALEEYEGLHSSQELANETVSLRIKAFSQGLSTSLDVVDAELFLAQVKTQRAVAVYNYIKALGTLVAISSNPESFFQYQNNSGIEE